MATGGAISIFTLHVRPVSPIQNHLVINRNTVERAVCTGGMSGGAIFGIALACLFFVIVFVAFIASVVRGRDKETAGNVSSCDALHRLLQVVIGCHFQGVHPSSEWASRSPRSMRVQPPPYSEHENNNSSSNTSHSHDNHQQHVSQLFLTQTSAHAPLPLSPPPAYEDIVDMEDESSSEARAHSTRA